MVEIKVCKLHPDAVLPSYAYEDDAGMDLTCIDLDWDENTNLVYKTGLAIKIPENHVGLLFPRSSVSTKNLMLTNCVGVLDPGYTGEITAKFKHLMELQEIDEEELEEYEDTLEDADPLDSFIPDDVYQPGDRIIQLIVLPIPRVKITEVDALPKTDRGAKGYGSSGN